MYQRLPTICKLAVFLPFTPYIVNNITFLPYHTRSTPTIQRGYNNHFQNKNTSKNLWRHAPGCHMLTKNYAKFSGVT